MDQEDASWFDHAACVGVDPELFFPLRGEPTGAKAVCRECPVRLECLQWALDHNEVQGVWGGMSGRERQRLKRRRRREAQEAASAIVL